MTRQDFVKIRKQQGKKASVTDAHPCPQCRAIIVKVVTRHDPRQYITWDAAPDGEIHECEPGPHDARS